MLEELVSAWHSAPESWKAAACEMVKHGPLVEVPPRPEEPILLNMVTAARRLGVSRTHLWKLIKAGRIRKIETLPGCYRIAAADLDAFVAQGRCRKGTEARVTRGGLRDGGDTNFTRRSGGGDDEAQQTKHRSKRA